MTELYQEIWQYRLLLYCRKAVCVISVLLICSHTRQCLHHAGQADQTVSFLCINGKDMIVGKGIGMIQSVNRS